MIDTPTGATAVEHLRQGDLVHTRDNGPQRILWTGSRVVTGARLYAMPEFRPLRILRGALGDDEPDRDLLVSPDHRLLVSADASRSLFGEREVLIAARDLLGKPGVMVDRSVRSVCYHHIMFDNHQVICAGGLASESFHPAESDLDALEDDQRLGFLDVAGDVYRRPQTYGAHARRALSAAEAALMRFGSERSAIVRY